MHGLALVFLGLLGVAAPTDYARDFSARSLDQASLEAEGYGEKKVLTREESGLRIVLPPGAKETGWKTPPQLRLGGDFTIGATFVIKKLPKPALEDGAAVGMAIAFNDANQPDLTLVRMLETSGADVYRTIDRASAHPGSMQPGMPGMVVGMGMVVAMGGQQVGGKPPKPPRHTFPAAGEVVYMELQREGQVVRMNVRDARSPRLRYIGQATLGPMDVAVVKLFAANRNGAEPVNVLIKDLTVQASRLTGLGTIIRTVSGAAVYGEPTGLENGLLIVGGPPQAGAPVQGSSPAAAAAAAAGATMANAGGRPVRVMRVVAVGGGVQAVVVAAPAPAAVAVPAAALTPAQAVRAQAQGQAAAAPAAAQAQAAAAPAAASGTALSDPFGPNARGVDVFAPPPAATPPPPKAKLPLEEVDSIVFERTPTLSGRFVDQPNLDFTGPAPAPGSEPSTAEAAQKKEKDQPARNPDGSDDVLAPPPGTTIARTARVEAKKNGIRDVRLSLFGLRPVKIKQVTVNLQTDKGMTNWSLDTAGSESWPLVVHRAGTELSADLFLEPPPADCHQKNFTINLNYEDGQAANVNFQADGHSDPKLAVDPKAPAPEQPDAWVHLTGDEKLFGKLGDISGESLRLTTPWRDTLEIPLSRIAGVHVGLLERKETPESFAKRLKARGAEDVLLAQTRKGEVIAIPGVLEGSDGSRLRFVYQGKTRTLPLRQVEGLVLASRKESPREELRPTFTLHGAIAISGRWTAIEGAAWKVQAPWGQEMKLPSADIQHVRFRGGRMTYLSDLEPARVEETPFFGHRMPWKRDVTLTGDRLRMNGKFHERGLAVHSRSSLTFDLDGRYDRFQSLVGFDEAAGGKGRVDCRVFADGKELFANPDLRADAPPVPLDLPVSGVRQLRLLVDYGRGQDTGDRVIWADARLHRQSQPRTDAEARVSSRSQSQSRP